MRYVIVLVCLGAVACSGSDDPPDANNQTPTNNNQTSTNNNTPAVSAPVFQSTVVEGLGTDALAGDNAQAAITAGGQFSVVYGYLPAGGAGQDREIRYAERGTDGLWTTEVVTRPGANAPSGGDLVGLGFAMISGTPHVVFIGGDDDGGVINTPFPTDLILATKTGGQWSERTLVDTSAEAAGDCSLYCNEGHVVGTHAEIAARPGGGFAVVYRDTHFGFATDDFARSDVEVYEEGGSVGHVVVDPERSGGTFGNITYAANGNPVVAYNLENESAGEDRVGVWGAAYDGTEWVLSKISDSQTPYKVAIGTAPSGTVYLAFYDANAADLVVATSSDNGLTWQSEAIDQSGKTGLHPSMTFDGEGRPIIAYTYCGETSDRDCPGQLGPRSEVRVARLEGSEWQTYLVDDGQGFGSVGLFTSVVVDPNGKIGIAFVDDRNQDLIFAREE